MVERLRDQIEFVSKPSLRRALAKQYDPALSLDDAEALFAAVEAAKESSEVYPGDWTFADKRQALRQALAALYETGEQA